MRLFDWLRTGKRQAEPEEEWWTALRRLTSDMEQLKLDWETTYGKVRRALATLSKRQEREEKDHEGGEDDQPPNGRPTAPAAADYAALRAMYGRR